MKSARTASAVVLAGTLACGTTGGNARNASGDPAGGLGLKGSAPAPGGTREVGFDSEAVRKVIQSHRSEVRACYEQQLAKDPKLEGKVSIRWRIEPDGRASSPMVVKAGTTLSSDEVARCIMSRLGNWVFPRPSGGASAIVTFPWILRPAPE